MSHSIAHLAASVSPEDGPVSRRPFDSYNWIQRKKWQKGVGSLTLLRLFLLEKGRRVIALLDAIPNSRE